MFKNDFKEDEIKWDQEGLSGVPIKDKSRRVYKLLGFIKSYVYCTLRNLANNPEIIVNKKYAEISSRDLCGPRLSDIWPKSHIDENDLYDNIRQVTFDEFNAYISEKPNIKMDNFTFLVHLALKRNWKKDCGICHIDDIKGTKCVCGCADIVILRPCGHAICLKPCFIKWFENKLEFKPKMYSGNGYTFIDNASYNVNLDLKDKKIECPACQVLIKETFQTSEICVNKLLADKIITKIYKCYTYKPFIL